MSDLSNTVLSAMLAYGTPAFAFAVLLASFGVPLPATMLLMAAGAFVNQGVFDLATTAPLALAASMLGDSSSYALGRYGGHLALRRFEGPALAKARSFFGQRGAIAIFLTRFMLTPLALPVNLIAGSSRYPYLRFLTTDLVGETIWVLLFGGMGYFFADQWEDLSSLVGNLAGALVGVAALGGSLYWLYRMNVERKAVAHRTENAEQERRAQNMSAEHERRT